MTSECLRRAIGGKRSKECSNKTGQEEFHHPVIVVDKLPMEELLGLDFIQVHGCVLDPA